jgi:hypothetical protein
MFFLETISLKQHASRSMSRSMLILIMILIKFSVKWTKNVSYILHTAITIHVNCKKRKWQCTKWLLLHYLLLSESIFMFIIIQRRGKYQYVQMYWWKLLWISRFLVWYIIAYLLKTTKYPLFIRMHIWG